VVKLEHSFPHWKSWCSSTMEGEQGFSSSQSASVHLGKQASWYPQSSRAWSQLAWGRVLPGTEQYCKVWNSQTSINLYSGLQHFP
jgi:hypothetical protein